MKSLDACTRKRSAGLSGSAGGSFDFAVRAISSMLLLCVAGCSDADRYTAPGIQATDSQTVQASNVSIKTSPGGKDEPGRFIVEGLSDEQAAGLARYIAEGGTWQELFPVLVAGIDATDIPPVAGSYELLGSSIVFTTRWPVEEGVRYRATFQPQAAGLDESLQTTAEIEVPRDVSGPRATVTAIYPTADVLPENLLKFYVHFSQPMSQGMAYDHVRLLDEQGAVVDLPFLELAEELWSPDGLRLTLLLDPGRIKRGLVPNEEEGPPLVAGNLYTLAIDGGWPDAKGVPIGQATTKAFRVAPPDRASPDPHQWELTAPPAGTREPLIVRFSEPLDSALAKRVLWVRGPVQESVAGEVMLDDHEQTWRIEPDNIWAAGEYHLVVGTELEDMAGNSVARPFEVPLDEKPVERPGDVVEISFDVPARRATVSTGK